MLKFYKRLVIVLFVFSVSITFAQSPQKINYQSIVRNNSNIVLASTTIGIKVSIVQGTITGSSVFTETHSTTTNSNGLMSIVIGNGTILSGAMSTINWANGPYFIKTEIDPFGGSNYSIIENREMISVPYAFQTATGVSGPQGDTGLQGLQGPSGAPGSFFYGTQENQMLYWDGTAWKYVTPPTAPNMILTYCNNKPVWTANGYCDIVIPTVITNAMAGISTTYAVASGEVTSDGNSPITARGFCWSQSEPNPTISNVPSNQVVYVTGGLGVYNGAFVPVTTGIVYYRAFAANQAGTAYGVVKTFSPANAVLDAPSKPVRATGFLCPNQVVTFNTNAVAGADAYLWELPSGWYPSTGTVVTTLPQISVNVGEASYDNATVRVAAIKITGTVNNIGPFSLPSDPDLIGHGTITYTTPGIYTFDVPSCVTKFHVTMNGGAGGLAYNTYDVPGDISPRGGRTRGAFIVGDLFFSATPGRLFINVGNKGNDYGEVLLSPLPGGISGDLTGTSGANYTIGDSSGGPAVLLGRADIYKRFIGGSGGGATDIRIGSNVLNNRVLVAGGGGGQGIYSYNPLGGFNTQDDSVVFANGGSANGVFEYYPFISLDGDTPCDLGLGFSGYTSPVSPGQGAKFTQVGGGAVSCSSGTIVGGLPGQIARGSGGKQGSLNGFLYSGGGGGGGYYGGSGGIIGGGGGGSSFIPNLVTVNGINCSFAFDSLSYSTEVIYTEVGYVKISW